MAPKALTRQELYDLVWSEPVSALAKQYGLSDRGFTKLCDRNAVPTPPRGYWAKSPAARKGLKPPLLLRSAEGSADVVLDIRARLSAKVASAPEGGAPKDRYRELYRELAAELPKIAVPERLMKPHPEIRKILDQDARWVASARSSIWSTAKSQYAEPLERRHLRIRSALLFAMEERGFTIRNHGTTPAEIEIVVGQNSLKLKISQRIGQYRRPLTEEELADRYNAGAKFKQGREETGFLRVKIDGWFAADIQQMWDESADEPLEDNLQKVLAGLIVAATYLREKQDADIAQAKAALAREEARVAALETRRIKAEQRRALHDRALSWRDAVLVREYVAAVNAAAGPGSIVDSDQLAEWTRWALEAADYLDPIVSGTATALEPLRPPVAPYNQWRREDPVDGEGRDARLRTIYGFPCVLS